MADKSITSEESVMIGKAAMEQLVEKGKKPARSLLLKLIMPYPET